MNTHRGLWALGFVAIAAVAQAQAPLHRQGLGGQLMDGVLPFEQVDPLSGNLVVTATDLVLPGNAGFDLRVQRFYNSALYPGYATGDLTIPEDSWAGLGWRLHFGRVFQPDATGSGETRIEMGDGSQHPLYTTSAFGEGWITRDFWLYDRATSTLKLPNGVVYTFGRLVHLNDTLGDVRYVTAIQDVFGNRLEFTYFNAPGPVDGVQRIRQILGASQEREVTFTYDASLKSLQTMQYGSRIWHYDQVAVDLAGHTVLQAVRPPQGLPWQYEYSTTAPGHELRVVHAPAGGTVTYTYGNASHRTGPVTTLTRVVATRTLGGRGIPTGTWTYAYDQGANQDQTVVNGPCNTTRYRFRGHGLSGDFSAWSAGALEERTTESGIAVAEREVFSYVRSEPLSPDYVPGEEGIAASNGVYNALLSERVLTRGTVSWTTGYVYTVGQGTFNDYGQPTTVTEFENPYSLRETIRAFAHSFTPYIRGRVASARVRVRTAYDEFSGPFEISWTYNPATGFLTRENRGGLVRLFEPDATGNVAAVEDALGHRTTLQYSWGRVRETRTDHVTVTATVNPDGTVAAAGIGDLGMAYTYDDAFRIASATPTNTIPVLYDYDDTDGDVVTVSRGSATERTQVDGFGRPLLSTAADGVLMRAEYTVCGQVGFQSAPYTAGSGSRGVAMTYDELGRLRTRTAPDGVVTTYTYAGIELTVTTPVSASETRTTLYQYLGFGSPADAYLRTVTDAAGQVTRYRYDVLNHLVRVEVPGVPARTWTYADDSRWLLAEETHPESGTTQYGYDAAGHLTSTTNALSETTIFRYDTSNRLEQIDPPGTADDVTVTFHPTYGRPSGQTTASVTTAWGYDAAGRLNARSDTVNGQTFTSTYTLDSTDNLSTITYPSGRVVTYHYDTANRLTEVLQNGAVFADTFTYGDTGALASYRTGAVTHTVTYDTRDRVERLTALAGGAGLDLTYAYDAADQVLAITDPRSGASQGYAYDPLGRLRTATGPWGTRSWTYSPSGDRLSETAGGVTTYQYDAATQRLLSTSGAVPEAFTSDALGRLTDDARGHYDYNTRNLLSQFTATGITAAHTYDAAGARLLHTVNGTTTYTLRSPGNQVLSQYETVCGTRVWDRDVVYAGGRLLGAVRGLRQTATVALASATASVAESVGSVSAAFVLTTSDGGPLLCPITVAYGTQPGTAAAGADYTAQTGTLTFVAGSATQATQSVSVPIVPDSRDEEHETFSVTISVVTGGGVGAVSALVVTVTDDDPVPALAISDVAVTEGASGSTPAVFTVSLSAASGRVVQVQFASSNGSAVAGGDYGAVSGTVTLQPGATTGTIAVPVIGDPTYETDESFVVTLSSPVHATIADAQGVGTILNDDAARRTWGDLYAPVDGLADGALFNPATGVWTIASAATGAFQTLTSFGQAGDIPVPADYTGDGRTDCAYYRPATGAWTIAPSCQAPASGDAWGGDPIDQPVPADYDGDGRADLAVFRRGATAYYWYLRLSATGATSVREWGWTWTTSIPVPGDYDGDGTADPAYFTAFNAGWWILPSSGATQYAIDFGFPGGTHVPTPGDYDGDGRTDPAFFYPADGGWYVRPSSTGVSYRLSFGASSGIPVPADYDGDGRTDPAYYAAGAGGVYVLPSSTGTVAFISLGSAAVSGAVPVLAPFGPPPVPPPPPPPPPPVCPGSDPFAALGGGTCCPDGGWRPPGMACSAPTALVATGSPPTPLVCDGREGWRHAAPPASERSRLEGGGRW